jgi:hypothetical protein
VQGVRVLGRIGFVGAEFVVVVVVGRVLEGVCFSVVEKAGVAGCRQLLRRSRLREGFAVRQFPQRGADRAVAAIRAMNLRRPS